MFGGDMKAIKNRYGTEIEKKPQDRRAGIKVWWRLLKLQAGR